MPNDQSHDTRTTNPANRLAQAVGLSVAFRPVDEPDSGPGDVWTATPFEFIETFDAQSDFTSTSESTDQVQREREGYTVPTGWDSVFVQDQWNPESGHSDRHSAFEILASDSTKARGGSGKAMVCYRESFSGPFVNSFTSDGQLLKFLPGDFRDVYVEFYIRFSPEWWHRTVGNTGNWQSKFFRIGSWSGEGSEFEAFGGGEQGPLFLWDYKVDNFGVRNLLTMRGGPHGANYSTLDNFAGSKNYTSDTAGMAPGGTDPQVPDLVNGGFLVDFGGSTTHEQVFGTSDVWTKMAFYVRMNSAEDVADGHYKQWINGERIRSREDVPWVQSSALNKMVGWNFVSLSGNDYFKPFPDEDRFEDWYAIDDVYIRAGIGLPEGLE